MGPRVELQDPRVSPFATQEDVGSLAPPSPPPTDSEAASMQRSPVVNTGMSATPDNAEEEDAEEAFRTETSGADLRRMKMPLTGPDSTAGWSRRGRNGMPMRRLEQSPRRSWRAPLASSPGLFPTTRCMPVCPHPVTPRRLQEHWMKRKLTSESPHREENTSPTGYIRKNLPC